MRNKMDKDTLLKIKAEAIADDYYSFNAMKISIVTLIFSSIAITIDIILQNINSIVSSIGCILCICIGMFAVVKFLGTNEWDSVVRWRKYVLIVVDELLDKKKKK